MLRIMMHMVLIVTNLVFLLKFSFFFIILVLVVTEMVTVSITSQ